MKAGTSERIGASEKRSRFAPAGTMSSLKKSLIPSAIGCRIPYGPTSIGPMRSCIQLKTFRSASVSRVHDELALLLELQQALGLGGHRARVEEGLPHS